MKEKEPKVDFVKWAVTGVKLSRHVVKTALLPYYPTKTIIVANRQKADAFNQIEHGLTLSFDTGRLLGVATLAFLGSPIEGAIMYLLVGLAEALVVIPKALKVS